MRHPLAVSLLLLAVFDTVGRAGDESSEQDAVEQQYRSLVAEYEALAIPARQRFSQATTDAERARLNELIPDGRPQAARIIELADRHRDKPIAAEALIWVVKYRNRIDTPEAEAALKQIGEHHLLSDKLGDPVFCFLISRSDSQAAEPLLRRLWADSPHRDVRGEAGLSLGRSLVRQAKRVERIKATSSNEMGVFERWLGRERVEQLKKTDSKPFLHEAESLFDRVVADYADIKLETSTLGEVAGVELAKIRDLPIGSTAHEIQGNDADGVAFKLSDYRGKVVLLTFSGNWCGPCRGMYPQDRRLVERLKAKPFALLSVNTDESKATLRKSIEAGEITWRCWYESGGPEGQIPTQWNVTAWPTIYLLDHRGKVRHKFEGSLGEETMDRLVDNLINEVTK